MAVLFVPASAGKRVQPGMRVRISPSTVKREEYGSMLGKVAWAAEFPSTQRGMIRLLGNEALVQKLMEEGPPIQVNVALERDPRTPTGYRWSSSTGPNLRSAAARWRTGASSSGRSARSAWSSPRCGRSWGSDAGLVAQRFRTGRDGGAEGGSHADRPADGGGRVRGRGPGHRPRPLRPLGAAGRAAHRLRRVARRQQGEQHRQGRPPVRPGGQGVQAGAAEPAHAPAADDPALELQPLRGARGLPQGSRST